MALVSDIAFVEYLRHLFSTHLWNMTYIGFSDHHGWCEEIPTFSILSFCEGWVKVITKYVPAQEATGSNVTICLHDTAMLLLVPSRACPPSPAGHHTRDDFAVQMSRWIMEQLSGLMTHFNTDIYILKRILYISLFFRQNNNAPSSYSLFTGHCMTVTSGGGF